MLSRNEVEANPPQADGVVGVALPRCFVAEFILSPTEGLLSMTECILLGILSILLPQR
jgi:hypothetical protein